MAEFGSNATGTYNTQNFINPQEGASDRSGETLLRVAGSATEQGYGLAAAFKGREFRGEIDKAVQQEIGKQFASKVEAQPADTQEFKDAIERAKQVTAQGGVGARTRTNLLAEKLTREKAGANPMFASIYKQVAQEVLGGYDATLQFMDMAEAAASEAAKAEKTSREKLISSAYGMFKNTGAPFDMPFEMMNDQQLMSYSLFASDHKRLTDEYNMTRQMMSDERSLRRTIASEQGAAAASLGANIAFEEKTRIGLERKGATIVTDKYTNGLNYLFISSLDSMRRGEVTPEQLQSQLNTAFATTTAQMGTDFNNLAMSAGGTSAEFNSQRQAAFAEVERIRKSISDYFKGDLSEMQRNADALKSFEQNAQVNLYKTMPEMAVLKNISPALLEGIGRSFALNGPLVAKLTGGVETALRDAANLYSGSITMEQLGEERQNAQRNVALSSLTDRNPTSVVPSNTKVFGDTWLTATYGVDNIVFSGEDRKRFMEALERTNFPTNFRAAEQESPGKAALIASGLHSKAEEIAQSYARKIQEKFGDSAVQLNPESGYFVIPDKPMEIRLNNFLDSLVASKVGDRRAPSDDTQARLYFLDKYFGISINPQEPQQ